MPLIALQVVVVELAVLQMGGQVEMVMPVIQLEPVMAVGAEVAKTVVLVVLVELAVPLVVALAAVLAVHQLAGPEV